MGMALEGGEGGGRMQGLGGFSEAKHLVEKRVRMFEFTSWLIGAFDLVLVLIS